MWKGMPKRFPISVPSVLNRWRRQMVCGNMCWPTPAIDLSCVTSVQSLFPMRVNLWLTWEYTLERGLLAVISVTNHLPNHPTCVNTCHCCTLAHGRSTDAHIAQNLSSLPKFSWLMRGFIRVRNPTNVPSVQKLFDYWGPWRFTWECTAGKNVKAVRVSTVLKNVRAVCIAAGPQSKSNFYLFPLPVVLLSERNAARSHANTFWRQYTCQLIPEVTELKC